MACPRCNHLGYIESETLRDGRVRTIILQCNACRDTKAYSAEVERRRGTGDIKPRDVTIKPWRDPARVIPLFRERE